MGPRMVSSPSGSPRSGGSLRLFAALAEVMRTLCARYSEAELHTIVDYLTRAAELFRRETQRLRGEQRD
jgi:hypothetical protein